MELKVWSCGEERKSISQNHERQKHAAFSVFRFYTHTQQLFVVITFRQTKLLSPCLQDNNHIIRILEFVIKTKRGLTHTNELYPITYNGDTYIRQVEERIQTPFYLNWLFNNLFKIIVTSTTNFVYSNLLTSQ